MTPTTKHSCGGPVFGSKTPSWTTHRVGEYIVHADAQWRNGNSPVGLALAVRLHESGRTPQTEVSGGTHVVHAAGETCGHCP